MMGLQLVPTLFKAVMAAKKLAEMLDNREGVRQTFTEHVDGHLIALEELREQGCLGPRTEPIQRQYLDIVERARKKIDKYRCRRIVQVYKVYKEASTIKNLTVDMDSKLALLSVCGVARLKESIQRWPEKATSERTDLITQHLQHLERVSNAVASSSQHTVTDVARALDDLRAAEVALRDEYLQTIAQRTLFLMQKSDNLKLQSAGNILDKTSGKLNNAVGQLQTEAWQDLKVVINELARDRLNGHLYALTEHDLSKSRLIMAVHLGLGTFLSADREPSVNEMLTAIDLSIKKGLVAGCGVLGVPYAFSGPLRPVKLQAERCTCSMSEAAAQASRFQRKCKICSEPLHAGTKYVKDEALERVMQAERKNMEVPVIPREALQKGEKLGGGGQGTVFEATMKNMAERVAVKEMTIPQGSNTAVLQHVANTTVLASDNAHVCKMYGVSWSSTDVWLVMERCNGTLTQLVSDTTDERKTPGMEPADVVMLGIMLCDALMTVHKFARSLHGDIKPDNIMLGSSVCKEASWPVSVKLIDFGLAINLPTRMTARQTAETGVQKGTLGYAAPEGIKTTSSDVYSLGATLLFALTNSHPYNGVVDPLELMLMRYKEQPMHVNESIEPPELRQLLRSMTVLDGTHRPSIEEVYDTLLQISKSLSVAGKEARVLQPHWGLVTSPPETQTSQERAVHHSQQPQQHLVLQETVTGRMASTSAFHPPDSTGHASPEIAWNRRKIWPVLKSDPDMLSGAPLFSLQTPPRSARITTINAKLMHIINGREAHLDGGCIVFDSSCKGMKLQATTFAGGVVICSGRGCSITFTDAIFQQCSLIVLDGARASVSNPSFCHGIASKGVAMLASDSGTRLDLQGGTIKGGAHGVSVQSGAQLEAVGVTISHALYCGFEGRARGTRMNLSNCTLRDFHSWQTADKAATDAVLIHAGCDAGLTEVTVCNVGTGVRITSKATASISGCAVSHTTAGHGVDISGGAVVKQVKKCFVFTAQKAGIHVNGSGTHAKLEDCTLTSCKGDGLEVMQDARAEAKGCTFSQNALIGVFAHKGAQLKAEKCDSERNMMHGCWAQDGARIVVIDCRCSSNAWNGCGAVTGGEVDGQRMKVWGSGRNGFMFGAKAEAQLKGCSCYDTSFHSISIRDQGTSITVHDCCLQRSGRCGVHVQFGGKGVMKEVTTSGHKEAGFWCGGSGSRLLLRKCTGATHDDFVAVNRGVMHREDCKPIDSADVDQNKSMWSAGGVMLPSSRQETTAEA